MEWKIAIVEVFALAVSLTPLYQLVLALIKLERAAVIQRTQILERLDFLEKRQDDTDEWRSANSGLRLK